MDVDKICVFEKNQHQIAFPKSVTYVYNANTCKQGKHKAYVSDVDNNPTTLTVSSLVSEF